jgi:hypothetical protein
LARLILPAALVAAFLLASCAGAPASYAVATPDPALQGLLAEATVQAVATSQAEAAARATATTGALLAAQQATRSALAAQQTAVMQATVQSIAATQTQVAGQEQTRQAVAVAAVTGTAIAMSTQEIRDAVLTVEAGAVQRQAAAIGLQATATRLSLEAERDREAAARGRWWAGMWLAAVAALVGGLLFLLYSFAARWWNESRIIRDGRGDVIAVRIGRGVLEYVSEPPAPLLLPAPAEETFEPVNVVRVNGSRRESLFQHDDDVGLHWNGMATVFTRAHIRTLREWYGQGYRSIRRDTSSMGPGFDQLKTVSGSMGSGSVYNTTRAVLMGLEYVEEDGSWTARGVVELLGLPRDAVVQGPSASSSRLQTGNGTVVG